MAESTEKQTMAERAADLSDEVLERVEARQRAAIEALRKFVDRLDDAMPNLVDDPSARKKVIDAIGDYYEQLATTTNEFVATMVRSAIGTLNERSARKLLRAPQRKLLRAPQRKLLRAPQRKLLRAPQGKLLRAPQGKQTD